jgi:hypothetical protein
VYRDSWKNIHLQQFASITKFSTEAFGKAIEGIAQIYTIFSHVFKDRILKYWQPSTYMEHPVIDMSNHYFTS